MDGFGTRYYNLMGDECYKGDWYLGERNGNGQYFRQNANGVYVTYNGNFYDNKYSGQGTMINYTDQKTKICYKFFGEWLEGEEYNGKGIIYYILNGAETYDEHLYINGKKR